MINEWLKNLRLAANFTQNDIACRCNISRPAYTQIERGRRKPRPELAQKIAKVLNFDWTKFFIH